MSAVEKDIDMVTIEVDGRELKAKMGEMLIRVTDREGIRVPRFCYHEKLSVPANCRMCLVDVEKSPKPLPACATPVADGMKVYTRSKRAVSAQQNVMEFLLINHPLDCPVCDQGGECELQDLSMGYGRSVSRFTERKRVVADPDLGPLISTDMTRCIHCTRCIRFLEEMGGTRELGAMGRGEDMKITTWVARSVDSELSGNVIDVCPVGALNNKPYRFKARAWEMTSHPVISSHDSVGSNLYLHVLRGKVMRAVPRDLEAVNECWLSDRDRYSCDGLYAPERLTQASIKVNGAWLEADWDDALAFAVEGLKKQIAASGADRFGVLASPRASVEELYLLQNLARQCGSHNVDCRLRQLDFSDQTSFARQPGLSLSIEDIAQLDAALLVGSNIRHDQPILGHRLYQAWRKNNAKISLVNPVAWPLHFDALKDWVVKPSAMIATLASIAKAVKLKRGAKPPKALSSILDNARTNDDAKAIGKSLLDSERKAVIVGNFAMCHPQASILRALAAFIADATGARLSLMPESANSAGGWAAGCVPHRLPGGGEDTAAGLDAAAMLQQPLSAYLLWDFDPVLDTALGNAALENLQQADFVVAASSYDCESLRACADVLLPVACLAETDASLVSCENRWQISPAAVKPLPDARAGWRLLRMLGHGLELDGFDFYDINAVRESLKNQMGALDEQAAYRIPERLVSIDRETNGFERIDNVPIYAADFVLRHTPSLQATGLAQDGWLGLNPDDAKDLGLSAGDTVTASQPGGSAEFQLEITDAVPPGAAWLPQARASSKHLSRGAIEISKTGERRG